MKTLFVAACLSFLAPSAFAEDAPVKCKLVKIGEWHLRFLGAAPVVDGAINGKPISILLSTGNDYSFITRAAAEKLDLPMHSTGRYFEGVGGDTRVLMTRVVELRVGSTAAGPMSVRVVGEKPINGVDFVLGYDFFKTMDVELDYANATARLFRPIDCGDKPLAYWDSDAQQLPMDVSWVPMVTVTVNGREATARISSGVSSSSVHLSFAEKLGITPGSTGVRQGSCTGSFVGDPVHEWIAPFDTIVIGGETIRNAHLRMGDYYSGGLLAEDLMLGGDFLKAHRVLISTMQRKLYATYTGGQVFPTIAGIDCSDALLGKKRSEALAAYDAQIAAKPNDVNALLARANLRFNAKDLTGALSDLDAAVAAEPGNGAALGLRARVRGTMKDYNGALADSQAAIEQGQRVPDMYVLRAALRKAADQPVEQVLEEYARALELDPHYVVALRSRGHLLFQQGKFEAAERDFVTALAIRPQPYDSLFIYLARARRGTAGREVLEDGLKQVKDAQWPTPVFLYFLDRMDRDAMLAAASVDEKNRKGNECEARFYEGEKAIISGKTREAKQSLEQARDECPAGFVERAGAIAELARLP